MNFMTFWLLLVMLILGLPCSLADDSSRRLLPIDDFDGGIQNRLGGYRNTFEKMPSTADAIRIPQARCGRSGKGLCLKVNRREEGFCGYWLHLFDMKSASRRFVDATDYSLLSFWVRGAVGGEKFKIKLADERWIGKEDSVAVASVDEFLSGGVTTQWQEVLVPLSDEYGLDLKRLGGVTFDFDTPGQATVFIDNVSLKSSPRVKLEPRAKTPTAPQVRLDVSESNRALWLWSTESMLDDPNRVDELIQFCGDQQINTVWAQLLYRVRAPKRDGDPTVIEIERESAFRRFLANMHRAGIAVHALDGYPEHALSQYHHITLALVDAVIAFNDGQPESVHFDGLHLDNEPHLLVGWNDPITREQILFEFLTLNHECQRRSQAASSELHFGVDIPFWLQDPDEETGEPIGVVSFNGRRKAASYHLLDMLDNVGVMNYRDAAQGADGMIAHSRDLLSYADASHRSKVYMGVETFRYQPTRVLFVVGRDRDTFRRAIRSGAGGLANLSRLDGHRLRVFDDGSAVHVGVEVKPTDDLASRKAIAATLCKIADALGEDSGRDASNMQESLIASLTKDSNAWSSAKAVSVRDLSSGQRHRLVSVNAIMPGKITFADENAKRFSSQVKLAEDYFSKHVSYGGLAVHHYESFRALVQPATGNRLTSSK